jgi:hypothetical protein
MYFNLHFISLHLFFKTVLMGMGMGWNDFGELSVPLNPDMKILLLFSTELELPPWRFARHDTARETCVGDVKYKVDRYEYRLFVMYTHIGRGLGINPTNPQ